MPYRPKRTDRTPYVKPPRSQATRRDYGTHHQSTRERLLRERPICERCELAWSAEAHHLRYPARTDKDYEMLCKPCHLIRDSERREDV